MVGWMDVWIFVVCFSVFFFVISYECSVLLGCVRGRYDES